MNPNREHILKKLQKICSRKEKCTHDIIEYLNKIEIPESLQDEIINKLKADRYVDDNRYALAAVNDKLNLNHWGKIKIRHFLTLKHIAEEIIDNALNSIDEEQYENLIREELRKKAVMFRAETPEDTEKKLMQFAASRGYEEEIARKLLNNDT